MKKAYLFPGQGSQKTGMGKDHYRYHARFRKRCEQAEEILGYPITKIMFEGPMEELSQTRHTQPALFLHSLALFELLGHHPDMVAGHSLGEYTALAAASVLTFEQALEIVRQRGELMQKAGDSSSGAMIAIVGLDDSIVESICSECSRATGEIVSPANYNSEGQLVISGHEQAVIRAGELLGEEGAKMIKKLPVSGAFHSNLMEPVQKQLDLLLDELAFSEPRFPVYSNTTGMRSTDPETLKENLKQQMVSPVKWKQTIQSMQSDGAVHFIEIGSGNVLQGLVRRTASDSIISGFE